MKNIEVIIQSVTHLFHTDDLLREGLTLVIKEILVEFLTKSR